MAQDKTKKPCLLQLISRSTIHMIIICMVHLCKMMMSLGFFKYFRILILRVVKGRGVKGQKMVQSEKKFCRTLHISGIIHMIFIYGTHV